MRENFREIEEDIRQSNVANPLSTLSGEILECVKDLRFYYNRHNFQAGKDSADCFYELHRIIEECEALRSEIVKKTYKGRTVKDIINEITANMEGV